MHSSNLRSACSAVHLLKVRPWVLWDRRCRKARHGQLHCVCVCAHLRLRECVRACEWASVGVWRQPAFARTSGACHNTCERVSTSSARPAQSRPPIRYLVRPLVRAVTGHQRGPCRCLMPGVCQACAPALASGSP